LAELEKLPFGAVVIVDFDNVLGIDPFMKGSDIISSRVGLFEGYKTNIFVIRFFALSEILEF
jgi:hypothetical protein